MQEWRTTCIALEKARLEQAVTNCSWFSKKKKPVGAKNGGVRGAFDAADVVTYEEVVRLPAYLRKTLVLIGKLGISGLVFQYGSVASNLD